VRRGCVSRESIDRCVNQLEGAVGLKEEVAGEPEMDNPAVLDLEVDDNEFATRNLEFAVH